MKIEKVEFYAEFLSFKICLDNIFKIMLYKQASEVSLFLTILKSFNKKHRRHFAKNLHMQNFKTILKLYEYSRHLSINVF